MAERLGGTMRGFRITVAILGLTLGLAMFIQTTLVYSLASAFNMQESTTQAGAAGVAMALMWLLAVALVFPLPQVSLGVFLLSGFVGVLASPDFSDLAIWGIASALLAGLSGVAWWEQHQVAREKAEDRRILRTLLELQMHHGGPPPANSPGYPYGPGPGY